jgi:hypothetical protein
VLSIENSKKVQSEKLKFINKLTDLKNDIQDDEDYLLFDQKIDHQPFDKENWNEMKSSKKVKKYRKRNDSSSNNSTTDGITKIIPTFNEIVDQTNSDNQE